MIRQKPVLQAQSSSNVNSASNKAEVKDAPEENVSDKENKEVLVYLFLCYIQIMSFTSIFIPLLYINDKVIYPIKFS